MKFLRFTIKSGNSWISLVQNTLLLSALFFMLLFKLDLSGDAKAKDSPLTSAASTQFESSIMLSIYRQRLFKAKINALTDTSS